MKEKIKCIFVSLRKGLSILARNNALILASSTAFFATFSISPIIVILTSVLNLYFQDDNITQSLFFKIRSTFGSETAEQIEEIVMNVKSLNSNIWITIGGFIFLLFVSTTLLKTVKLAIHQIWHIKKNTTHKFRYNSVERLIGLGMVLALGLLFIISVLLDSAVIVLQDYLSDVIPSLDSFMIRILNTIFSLFVVTIWFGMLFKFLPDARVKTNIALLGGLITGALFNIGKFVLGKLLVYNNVVNIFGTSAAIALLLLFIFYSSLILYLGASFTYAYAKEVHLPIKPARYSSLYELTMVSNDNK